MPHFAPGADNRPRLAVCAGPYPRRAIEGHTSPSYRNDCRDLCVRSHDHRARTRPGEDDWRAQYIALYERTLTRRWYGPCGECLNKCTAQHEWPFEDPVFAAQLRVKTSRCALVSEPDIADQLIEQWHELARRDSSVSRQRRGHDGGPLAPRPRAIRRDSARANPASWTIRRFDFATFASMAVNRAWGVTDGPGVRVFKLPNGLSFRALRLGQTS